MSKFVCFSVLALIGLLLPESSNAQLLRAGRIIFASFSNRSLDESKIPILESIRFEDAVKLFRSEGIHIIFIRDNTPAIRQEVRSVEELNADEHLTGTELADAQEMFAKQAALVPRKKPDENFMMGGYTPAGGRWWHKTDFTRRPFFPQPLLVSNQFASTQILFHEHFHYLLNPSNRFSIETSTGERYCTEDFLLRVFADTSKSIGFEGPLDSDNSKRNDQLYDRAANRIVLATIRLLLEVYRTRDELDALDLEINHLKAGATLDSRRRYYDFEWKSLQASVDTAKDNEDVNFVSPAIKLRLAPENVIQTSDIFHSVIELSEELIRDAKIVIENSQINVEPRSQFLNNEKTDFLLRNLARHAKISLKGRTKP